MKNKLYKITVELFVFLVSFIFTTKAFYYAESILGQDFINFAQNPLTEIILFAILLISMLFSGYIASKNKLKPIKFMQTDKQAQTIEFKKLIKSKKSLFVLLLALFFCLTYDNLIHLNDYSQQALLLVLVFYCPLSTILEIKNRKK